MWGLSRFKSMPFLQFQINENNQIKEISRKEKIHSTSIWQIVFLFTENNLNEIISVSDGYYLKLWELDFNNSN